MSRQLLTRDGREFYLGEYEPPEPGPRDVRIRVQFAAPKHGTESHLMAGSVFNRKKWDPDLRLFLPREDMDEASSQGGDSTERGIGNMVVGKVIAIGGEVTRFKVGDEVFGYGPIREEHQAPEGAWYPREGLAPEDAVCVDPAHVAFVAVRDGNVRIGDDVAVFGLGAIGLLAVQIARAGGARSLFAVDPVALRREYASAHGVATALDPTACDVGLEIKRATGGKGVDVSLETSGNSRALHEAIRCIRQCGTVVHVPWGPKDASHLHLDEEFHLNRPTIIGSQAVWDNPDRSHPLWNRERAFATVIGLFRDGILTGKGLVTPIVPFDDAAEALGHAFSKPQEAIKVGVRFD